MSLGNALLWTLVGDRAEAGHTLPEMIPGGGASPLLLAMCLARAGRIDTFHRLCRARDDMAFGPLADYCLFVGLTRDIECALALFKVLKSVAPLEAGVWWALAQLQAACGDEAAALRSAAVHAELTGRPLAVFDREDIAVPGAAYGTIRILKGDVTIDL